MGSAITWVELKKRLWIRVMLVLVKIYSIALAMVLLVKFVPSYKRGDYVVIFRVANILAAVLPCYSIFFTLFLACLAKTPRSLLHEFYTLATVALAVANVISQSKLLFDTWPNGYYNFSIFVAMALFAFRMRRQGLDTFRLVDREYINSPFVLTFALGATFQTLFSFGIASLLWVVFKQLLVLAVNRDVTLLPNNYYLAVHAQSWTLPLALAWNEMGLYLFLVASTILLLECFYELLNRHASHLDTAIANSVVDLQFTCFEDKLIIGRCLYNYARGIPLKLNYSRHQYETCGPSLNVPLADKEDPRRCSMQPVAPINIKNTHYLEPNKGRFHVDALCHRMLMENNGQLFSDLVNVCITCIYDLQLALQVLLRCRNACATFKGASMHAAANDKALDYANASIIYLRAALQWLCIANMLGYQNNQIQRIARELMVQAIKICNISALVKQAKLSTRLARALECLEQAAFSSLKSLYVYNQCLAYTTFDADYDTYRIAEKLYKPTTTHAPHVSCNAKTMKSMASAFRSLALAKMVLEASMTKIKQWYGYVLEYCHFLRKSWRSIVKSIFTEPNLFFSVTTFCFSISFLLVFAYYRIRETITDVPNIVKIKRNLQALAKDRIKRYLLGNYPPLADSLIFQFAKK